MSITTLVTMLPSYASDLKINLTNAFKNSPDGLTNEQIFGAAITAAILLEDEKVYNLVKKEAKLHLEQEQFNACKTAVMIMSTYNTYHFFSHNQSNQQIKNLDPQLECSAFTQHGIDKVDFEVNLLTASIINRCEYCVNFYTEKLLKRGISEQAVTDIAKISATLQAAVKVLHTESLRSYDFMAGESNF